MNEIRLSGDITIKRFILVFLSIVILFVCCLTIAFWFYLRNHPELLPTTVSVTYVGDVVDKDGESYSFIEVEHWTNKNNNGIEVYEFTLTGYTDWQKGGVLSKGVQYVAESGFNDGIEGFSKYSYDKQKDIAWASVTELNREQMLWADIDGTYYAISLDGSQKYYTEETNVASVLGGVRDWFKSWVKADQEVKFTTTVEHTTYEDLDTMFETMLKKLSTSNIKNGTYKMSLVDLSNYFKLQRYDSEKAKLVDCDSQLFNIDYFNCKVTVHDDGLQTSQDSNYGMFANDNNYMAAESNNLYADYGTSYITPVLSIEDFTWKIYDEYKVYLAENDYIVESYKNVAIPTIKSDVLNVLKSNEITKVKVEFDLSLFLKKGYTVKNVIAFSGWCGELTVSGDMPKIIIET